VESRASGHGVSGAGLLTSKGWSKLPLLVDCQFFSKYVNLKCELW